MDPIILPPIDLSQALPGLPSVEQFQITSTPKGTPYVTDAGALAMPTQLFSAPAASLFSTQNLIIGGAALLIGALLTSKGNG